MTGPRGGRLNVGEESNVGMKEQEENDPGGE